MGYLVRWKRCRGCTKENVWQGLGLGSFTPPLHLPGKNRWGADKQPWGSLTIWTPGVEHEKPKLKKTADSKPRSSAVLETVMLILFLLLLAILGRTDKLSEVVSRTYSIFSLLLAKAWLFFHLEWPSAPSSAADTFPIQHSETKTSFYLFYTAKFHPFFTRPVMFSFYFWIYSLSCTQPSGSTYQIAANQ